MKIERREEPVDAQTIIDLATAKEQPRVLEMIEWFDDRFYRVLAPDGERYYPSVTSILGIINKPFLSRWRGDLGNYEADRRMNYAAWRGSRIHDAIHKLLTLNEAGEREPLDNMVDGKSQYGQDEWLNIYRFSEFYDTLAPKVWHSELIVFSSLFEYAGTADLICELKAGDYKIGERGKVTVPEDGLYIGDIKTGKSIDDDYHFQTAAYAMAVEEMGVGQPVGTFIVHTSADTNAGWKVYMRDKAQMTSDGNLFLAAQSLFKAKNPNNSPRFLKMPASIILK